LINAVVYGCAEVAVLLIENGADVNIKDDVSVDSVGVLPTAYF
jgi:hypothetical protein